jgi:hypothetical protein
MFGTDLLPHHAAQAKALTAAQIAGKAGAVSNAREASQPQSAAAELRGRRPPADPDLAARPQQVQAPRFITADPCVTCARLMHRRYQPRWAAFISLSVDVVPRRRRAAPW